MSDEEIAQEIAVLQASGAPAYYLGDEADGHDLATVDSSGVGDLGATGNGFGYGFHCEDGGCLSDVTVATLTVGPGWLGAGECERLEPVLGVPAVGRDYQLVLFTGESVIMLDDSDYGDDRKGERELAEELQRVGQSGSVKELPPPSPALLALLEEACEG